MVFYIRFPSNHSQGRPFGLQELCLTVTVDQLESQQVQPGKIAWQEVELSISECYCVFQDQIHLPPVNSTCTTIAQIPVAPTSSAQ